MKYGHTAKYTLYCTATAGQQPSTNDTLMRLELVRAI